MLYALLILACAVLLTWALSLHTRLAEVKIENANLITQINRKQDKRSAELDDEYNYLNDRRNWRHQHPAPQITVEGLGLKLVK